jgi:hypothetical protein
MTAPNVLSAVRAALRAEASVTALVPAAQIYAGSMSREEVASQPRPAIIVRRAGGFPMGGHVQIARPRVDVLAYGTTEFQADFIGETVYAFLKALTRKRVTSAAPAITPTLVHSVSEAGGPTNHRDPDGDWPFQLRTYEVLVAEVAPV